MWMTVALIYNPQRQLATAGDPSLRSQRPGVTARLPRVTFLLVLATSLLMGMRYQIGGDWIPYLANYNQVQLLTLGQALGTFDIGYAFLVYVAGRLNSGIWLVNFVCGLIMTLGILRFCSRQPNPALSFLVAIPYLIIVVGMGYTRQGTAIGLVLAGLADADGRSARRIIIYILAGALFHKTALLVLPLALAPIFRRNFVYSVFAVLLFAIMFAFLLRGSTDRLVANYVDVDYESGGATVRVAMNLLPAILALTLRKRLGFSPYQSEVWSVFAIVALATFPLVLTSGFTTAIDRMALFLIPLQIAILPRIPYLAGTRKFANAQAVLLVCLYSGVVQLVWLVYATHARFWVPYRAFLFST